MPPRSRSRLRLLSRLALACVLLTPLAAHDTWLQPTAPAIAVGAGLDLQLTSGHGFNGVEYGPQPDRVVTATGRLAGATFPLAVGAVTEKFLPLSARPRAAGVARFAVELKPRDLVLKPEVIADYLREIHDDGRLLAAWEKIPAPKQWRERYGKCATTFVRVGPAQPDDDSWREPAGLSLEIVPQVDPTRLRVGDQLTVQVLKFGQPFAGLPLTFVSDGEVSHHVVKTDAHGVAAVTLDRAGRWLVRGTHLWRSASNDREWESLFVTLVVAVAPAS